VQGRKGKEGLGQEGGTNKNGGPAYLELGGGVGVAGGSGGSCSRRTSLEEQPFLYPEKEIIKIWMKVRGRHRIRYERGGISRRRARDTTKKKKPYMMRKRRGQRTYCAKSRGTQGKRLWGLITNVSVRTRARKKRVFTTRGGEWWVGDRETKNKDPPNECRTGRKDLNDKSLDGADLIQSINGALLGDGGSNTNRSASSRCPQGTSPRRGLRDPQKEKTITREDQERKTGEVILLWGEKWPKLNRMFLMFHVVDRQLEKAALLWCENESTREGFKGARKGWGGSLLDRRPCFEDLTGWTCQFLGAEEYGTGPKIAEKGTCSGVRINR